MQILQSKYGIDDPDIRNDGNILNVGFLDVSRYDPSKVEAIAHDVASECMDVDGAAVWVLRGAHFEQGKCYGSNPIDIPYTHPRFYTARQRLTDVSFRAYIPGVSGNLQKSIEVLMTAHDKNDSCDLDRNEMYAVHHTDFMVGLLEIMIEYGDTMKDLKKIFFNDMGHLFNQICTEDNFLQLFCSFSDAMKNDMCKYVLYHIRARSESLYTDVLILLAQKGFAYRHQWQPNDAVLSDSRSILHGQFKIPSAQRYPFFARLFCECPTNSQVFNPSTSTRLVCLPL